MVFSKTVLSRKLEGTSFSCLPHHGIPHHVMRIRVLRGKIYCKHLRHTSNFPIVKFSSCRSLVRHADVSFASETLCRGTHTLHLAWGLFLVQQTLPHCSAS